MSATRNEIQEWVLEGKEKGATHVIIALDTWDYENYPVYVYANEDIRKKIDSFDNSSDRIDEVYNLSMDIEQQLNSVRARNL